MLNLEIANNSIFQCKTWETILYIIYETHRKLGEQEIQCKFIAIWTIFSSHMQSTMTLKQSQSRKCFAYLRGTNPHGETWYLQGLRCCSSIGEWLLHWETGRCIRRRCVKQMMSLSKPLDTATQKPILEHRIRRWNYALQNRVREWSPLTPYLQQAQRWPWPYSKDMLGFSRFLCNEGSMLLPQTH